MEFDANRIIQSELEPRESLLWAGQPQQGARLRGSDIFLVPFSLMWGGFAIFWEYSVIEQGAPFFFTLFGVPFVLIGIYLIFGRFYVDSKQRHKTFYGISNERVIIVSGLFRKNVKSLNIRTLTDVSLSESSNGRGSITFGHSMPFASFFGGTGWPGMSDQLGPRFDLIERAKDVYQKIREAQRNAS